ncbi:MAG: hypothetical protein H7A24_06045 [Leptospiraceae bacterium]|nr:hypothetical protein [Leptospiraceae bacterium]MCP5511421.1 hypothetical protein [Leptospiraceae bacterium]
MVIKSLEYPVYYRRKQGGLAGQDFKQKEVKSANFGKTFEEYLSEAFEGEKVQDGSWFSSGLSDLTKRNLGKI